MQKTQKQGKKKTEPLEPRITHQGKTFTLNEIVPDRKRCVEEVRAYYKTLGYEIHPVLKPDHGGYAIYVRPV